MFGNKINDLKTYEINVNNFVFILKINFVSVKNLVSIKKN